MLKPGISLLVFSKELYKNL